VLAVNDPGFRRMHFQVAFCQPRLKLCFECQRFLLVPAVDQPIVCIPTPREIWVHPCHPEIKRVMQEQVCQNRADDAPLRGATRSLGLRTIIVFQLALWRWPTQELPDLMIRLASGLPVTIATS